MNKINDNTQQINLQAALAGKFVMTVSGPRGTRHYEFDNLILNSGLNRLGTGGGVNFCQVGSGNTVPSVAQTGLVAHVAGTGTVTYNNQTFVPGAAPYSQLLTRFRFGIGAAAGILSEVGVGWGATGSTLFSRALILDSNGTPTTITILEDEALDVDYTLRLYPPLTEVTSSRNISGVTTNYTLKAADTSYPLWSAYAIGLQGFGSGSILAYGPGPLGPITGRPTGTFIGSTSTIATKPYVDGSNSIELESTFAIDQANDPGGIGAVIFIFSSTQNGIISGFQCSFTPPIPKTEFKTLRLNAKVTWARKV